MLLSSDEGTGIRDTDTDTDTCAYLDDTLHEVLLGNAILARDNLLHHPRQHLRSCVQVIRQVGNIRACTRIHLLACLARAERDICMMHARVEEGRHHAE